MNTASSPQEAKQRQPGSPRVFLVSELYFPEETSTGHVMTTIAEGLASTFDVTVICAQPSYSRRGTLVPRFEFHNEVKITRVRSTSFDPHSVPLRLANFASVSLSCFLSSLRHLRRGDHVFVVTNPPLLPFLVIAAARIRGARSSIIVHDLFPDVLEPAGILKASNRSFRLMQWLSTQLFSAAGNIILVGRDQAVRVSSRLGQRSSDKVHVIRQSADLDQIQFHSKAGNSHLRQLGLANSQNIIIQFAGNIGPLQVTDELIEMIAAADHLPRVKFLFFGDGRRRKKLEEEIARRGLSNVTIQDPVPRSEADQMHAASDVALISLAKGMLGVSVPSRIGNALASGRPILGVVDKGSELELLIDETDCGWWVDPQDRSGFVSSIERIVEELTEDKQRRARDVSERIFDARTMIDSYTDVVHSSELV